MIKMSAQRTQKYRTLLKVLDESSSSDSSVSPHYTMESSIDTDDADSINKVANADNTCFEAILTHPETNLPLVCDEPSETNDSSSTVASDHTASSDAALPFDHQELVLELGKKIAMGCAQCRPCDERLCNRAIINFK